jgi:hypothetical protein
MVAACRGVAEARRGSGREARFRASGRHSVRGEEPDPMKKLMSGLAIAAIASSVFLGAASAQRNADSGNGGVSNSSADGGGVNVGDTGTGGTTGGAIDLSGAGTGDNLAQTIILQVLAGLQ